MLNLMPIQITYFDLCYLYLTGSVLHFIQKTLKIKPKLKIFFHSRYIYLLYKDKSFLCARGKKNFENFLQKHIHVRLSKTLLLIQQNKNLFEGVEAGTLLFALSLMSSAMGKFGFFGVRVGVRPGLLTGKLFGTQWRPCRTAMRLSRMSIACRVLWAARSC